MFEREAWGHRDADASARRVVGKVGYEFEWDVGKAASNRRKHGVSFDEAETVFADPLSC